MNLDDLTIGQAKELFGLFGNPIYANRQVGLDDMLAKKVIIRTYSAGVWYGTLLKKHGDEVIITGARRLWKWWAKKSISLSAVAIYGIMEDKSKIAPAVDEVWLQAIEIIPCSSAAKQSIEEAPDAKAE